MTRQADTVVFEPTMPKTAVVLPLQPTEKDYQDALVIVGTERNACYADLERAEKYYSERNAKWYQFWRFK